MSWIIFLQFIPYFLVCKKVFIWKLQPPLLLSLFCGYLLAQRMCRWCSSSSSFHPHAHPFPVPVTASALQLRQRIRVSFFFWLPFSASKPFTPLGCGGRMRRMEQGAGGLHSVSSPWATSKNIRPCLHRIQAAVYYYFLRPLLFPLLFAPFSPFSFY